MAFGRIGDMCIKFGYNAIESQGQPLGHLCKA